MCAYFTEYKHASNIESFIYVNYVRVQYSAGSTVDAEHNNCNENICGSSHSK